MTEKSDRSMRERVKKGYEQADYPSRQSAGKQIVETEAAMMEAFVAQLPSQAHVVDMGCGSGVPYDRFLVDKGYAVTGVDIAENHIRAARDRVPEADYVLSDFTTYDPGTVFDGLICMFALFHIPRKEHLGTLKSFHDLLTRGAPVLITMATEGAEEMTADFEGAEMVWSFYGAETNLQLLRDAGFKVRRTERIPDDRGGGDHLWVLADRV